MQDCFLLIFPLSARVGHKLHLRIFVLVNSPAVRILLVSDNGFLILMRIVSLYANLFQCRHVRTLI